MTTNVSPPQRRKFLFTMLGGLGALIGAASAWPVFRFLSPIAADDSGDKVIVARGDVVGGKAHFFQYQGKPAVVLQPAPGEFVALSAVCTHLGCVVAWQEQANEFLCPCHGGRFSAVGQVLAGPPPSPLETLAVELDGDQLKIG
jgi:cytochrome b6-f complex iron-sulfur subunit